MTGVKLVAPTEMLGLLMMLFAALGVVTGIFCRSMSDCMSYCGVCAEML